MDKDRAFELATVLAIAEVQTGYDQHQSLPVSGDSIQRHLEEAVNRWFKFVKQKNGIWS